MPGKLPELFKPMLASLAAKPFDSPDFLFEVKWDGVRTLCFCDGSSTRLFSRSGREVTHQYPEFAGLHEQVGASNAVIDAEIVAMDANGRPSFERLQSRINLSRPNDIKRAVDKVSLDLVCFDIVHLNGRWIGDQPLSERTESLSKTVSFEERVMRSEPIAEHGDALFRAARERNLEGIVAKKSSSLYLPGKRSREWLKIKVVQNADCVIGGWTSGQGRRGGSLGALLVGIYEGDDLRYIGSVGTGFTDKALHDVQRELQAIASDTSPFSEKIPGKGIRWVRPKIVCEVEYRELTAGFRFRAPSFKGLRPDKDPTDCRLQAERPVSPPSE